MATYLELVKSIKLYFLIIINWHITCYQWQLILAYISRLTAIYVFSTLYIGVAKGLLQDVCFYRGKVELL